MEGQRRTVVQPAVEVVTAIWHKLTITSCPYFDSMLAKIQINDTFILV